MRLRRTLSAVACLLAVAGLLFVLGYLQSPSRALFWRELMNLGHVPLFAVVSLALLGLFRSVRRGRPDWDYALALAGGLALGFTSEWIQLYGERDADLWDFLRNVAGVLSSLALAASLDPRLRPLRPWKRPGLRVFLRVLAVLLVFAALVPVLIWAEAYRQRWARMPVLYHFDSSWERRFMEPRYAGLELVAPPPEWAGTERRRVGKLVFYTAHYPRLILLEPYPDWRGHGYLALDLFLEGDQPFPLNLRIDDWVHLGHYTDRYQTRIVLEPGVNRMRIPLREIRLAPQGREMEMDRIYALVLFGIRPPEPVTLYLADLRLEPR